jgi:hypothetical protein
MGELDPEDLRKAPRFHAYFKFLEGRRVLLMSRADWAQLSTMIRSEAPVEIELSSTPIATVMRDSTVVAVVAERRSETEVVIEVYRDDPKDAPARINRDAYRVWERLPSHLDYQTVVNTASTEDNANMRGFLQDYVFLVKDAATSGHRLIELPARVRGVLRQQ